MSSISPVLSESYDDVFAAVQESERGRWFLGEYAARLRTKETQSVLDAIHKLENVVGSMPQAANPSPAMERVKAAIQQARNQLGALQPNGKPLSDEAQMFAHLAKLSRQAIETQAPQDVRDSVGQGLDVALNLVQQLENDLQVAPTVAKPKSATTETQRYFQQDADVFAPVQTGASTTVQFKVPSAAAAVPEQPPRGAKLTIHKGEALPAQNTPTENDPAPANSGTSSHEPLPDSTAAENKPRIVIIRRKPEELSAVPLTETESAA